MDNSFFLGLIYNASLLLAMFTLFEIVVPRLKEKNSFGWKILLGVILGGIGLTAMETNWELVPGVIFDTRSVLLGITGLFFGWIPTVIAILMTSSYRVYLGGAGVYMGIAVILESGIIGLLWRNLRKDCICRISLKELYIFGVLIHLVMLFFILLLPSTIFGEVFFKIWFPVITIYPVLTVVIGSLMSHKLRRDLVEVELKESEKKFSQIFKNGPQIITVSTIENGKLVDVNDAFTDVLGFSKDEARGKTALSLNLWVHESDRSEMIRDLKTHKVLRNREYQFRKKNGEIITCLGSSTIIEISGKKYLLLLGVNIEDRKKAERVLEEFNKVILYDKQRMDAILREMGDAVFVTNGEKNIILANKAMEQLFGITEAEMLGKNIEEVLILSYETSSQKPLDLIKTVFEEKKQARSTETLKLNKKDGTSSLIDSIASPIIDKDKNLVGTVWVFHDVTKERELIKAKTDFVTLASHQLRTPLTGIKWFVEILTDNYDKIPAEKAQEYIQKIGLSNERLISLVEDLLNTSRIENGKLAREIESHSLKELLRQSIEAQGIILLNKNIEILGMDKIPDDLIIDVDSVQFIQIFGNLLNNAASYSHSGGKIEVKTTTSDGKVIVSVKDNGLGIPLEQQGKIFSKFFRADNIARIIPGTGLGLYVAKNMVENHGGKIWFKSEENFGTTFFVELPLKQPRHSFP